MPNLFGMFGLSLLGPGAIFLASEAPSPAISAIETSTRQSGTTVAPGFAEVQLISPSSSGFHQEASSATSIASASPVATAALAASGQTGLPFGAPDSFDVNESLQNPFAPPDGGQGGQTTGAGAGFAGALPASIDAYSSGLNFQNSNFGSSGGAPALQSGMSNAISNGQATLHGRPAMPMGGGASPMPDETIWSNGAGGKSTRVVRPDAPPPATKGIALGVPGYVLVDGSDYNNSPMITAGNPPTSTGIPTTYDFAAAGPFTVNDPNIVPATVTINNLPLGGTWTGPTITYSGSGRISLWTDAKKSAAFTAPPAGMLNFTFYIEGTHESAALNDVSISFIYTVNNVQYPAAGTLSVTPVISSFGVTPNSDPGDPNHQNVVFHLPNQNANNGLQAETPKANPGALFQAVMIVGNPAPQGNAAFIQDFELLWNGIEGTKNKNGTSVGWLFNDMSGMDVTLVNGSLPLLDVLAGSTTQQYKIDLNYVTNGGTLTMTADDSPTIAPPDNASNGLAVDLQEGFQLYLAWEWSQVVQGSAVSVFYPVAFTDWAVTFYAKATGGVPPINQIKILDGVNSWGSNDYTASNDAPDQMDLTKIGAGNLQWSNVN